MSANPHIKDLWPVGRPTHPDPNSICVCAIRVHRELTAEDLPACDRERAQRILHPMERARHITARHALRSILGRLLQQAPEDLLLTESDLGKPHLANHELHFSVSHSQDWIMLAFAQSPLGVDVQHKKTLPHMQLLAKRFFSADEQAYMGDHHDRFFQIWTLKEAYLKATGEGIRRELSRFSVVTPSGQVALQDPDAQTPWNLHQLPDIGDCAASLACTVQNMNICRFVAEI